MGVRPTSESITVTTTVLPIPSLHDRFSVAFAYAAGATCGISTAVGLTAGIARLLTLALA